MTWEEHARKVVAAAPPVSEQVKRELTQNAIRHARKRAEQAKTVAA